MKERASEMGIVSSQPVVLIGPGSEWFWSAAQFVVVAVSLLGIYYQLRLQRAANAFDQLARLEAEWTSELLIRARLSVARSVQARTATPIGALSVVGQFWERTASLAREGHVDARLVYESIGSALLYSWAMLGDEVVRRREQSQVTDLLIHFEWLAGRFAEYAKEHGTTVLFTREAVIGQLDQNIAGLEDRLQMVEASRPIPAVPGRRRSREASAGGRAER
jgi:hypothetical protein